MKTPPGDQSRAVRISVRLYEWLLRLYPKPFRRHYGQPMWQLFRDQCREACNDQAGYGLARLWIRVFADLAVTCFREHFTELSNRMNTPAIKAFLGRPRITFSKIFVATFMVLASILVMSLVFWIPKSYSSTARVAVEKKDGSPGGFDPYFIQTEFARLQSRAVLDPVIDELNLTRWLARQQGKSDPFTASEAYEVLKGMVVLRQTPNTGLFEVRVFSGDGHAAAAIANRLVESYRRVAEALALHPSVAVIDPAEPGLRPVHPNLPFNLALGIGISLVLAALVAVLFGMPARKGALR